MRNLFTVWRRETVSCFLSPVAYVTMVVFLAMTAWTFMLGVLRNTGQTEPISSYLFGAVFVWLAALITVISMRLFTEEKRSGTIETLMTAPVTEKEVVLGKFAGALTFLTIVIAPTLVFLFVLVILSPSMELAQLDTGALLGGGLILLLASSFFTAIGLLISLTTRNQIISSLCILSSLWVAMLLGWLLSGVPGTMSRIGEYISITAHIEEFCRGSIDARPIVLYVSATVFTLFAAIRVLESRRWR